MLALAATCMNLATLLTTSVASSLVSTMTCMSASACFHTPTWPTHSSTNPALHSPKEKQQSQGFSGVQLTVSGSEKTSSLAEQRSKGSALVQ